MRSSRPGSSVLVDAVELGRSGHVPVRAQHRQPCAASTSQFGNLRWGEPVKDEPADRVHVPGAASTKVSHPAAVSRALVARTSSRQVTLSTRPRSSAPPGAERLAAVDHQRRLHPAQGPAIASAFFGAAWQRCRAPFLRNVLAQVPKSRPLCPPPQSPRSITRRWLRSSTPTLGTYVARHRAGILAGSGVGVQPTDTHVSEGQ